MNSTISIKKLKQYNYLLKLLRATVSTKDTAIDYFLTRRNSTLGYVPAYMIDNGHDIQGLITYLEKQLNLKQALQKSIKDKSTILWTMSEEDMLPQIKHEVKKYRETKDKCYEEK